MKEDEDGRRVRIEWLDVVSGWHTTIAYLTLISVIFQLAPIGTTIFEKVRAVDIDAGVNGLSEYYVIPGDNITLDENNAVDGYGFFSIPLPHQGIVVVNRTLDYERTQKYLVTIVASVSLLQIFHIRYFVYKKNTDSSSELRLYYVLYLIFKLKRIYDILLYYVFLKADVIVTFNDR